MKTEFFQRSVLGMAIAVLCSMGILSPINSPAQTPPDAPPPDSSAAPAELPSYIFPTSPLAQVIRLTQAGVDQSIILTFVANSSSTFNLDSDKIIFLKDIGLPNEVVTAMMQRDQVLQQQMAAAAPPPVPPAPETASNPETEPAPPAADQPEPAPTEVTVNYFYDTLTPYGGWVNVDGYGRCWRPSVCVYNPGWQPYCDHGHWVYTDCGWYWSSDYSWGWAPFHYGRWFQHPHMGWCWTPDTVWGPSWVTWRYSNSYCGWAPLPPYATYRAGIGFFYRGSAVSFGFNWGLNENCFTFVPTQFFCDPHPRRHCVAPAQVTQVFNQTTVINNFNVHDHNLVNGGIAPEHISAVTHNPIRPVALRHGTGPHRDQLSQDGSTLIASRPGPMNHPVSGGNRNNHLPPSEVPAQNHSLQPNHNWPATQTQPARQTQVPVVTTRSPQEGNAIRVPPQHPLPPASYNSSPAPVPAAPYQNNRTDSPRNWQQTHPSQSSRSSPDNSGAPAPGQHNAPAPAPQPPQHNQPHNNPPPAAPAPSSNPNQNQTGSGNSSGNSYGNGPRH
jgi:hypothetical protein